jgi:hypothetical protein
VGREMSKPGPPCVQYVERNRLALEARDERMTVVAPDRSRRNGAFSAGRDWESHQ